MPIGVLQILAIDLGTDTLPALALGREPAEPGIMARPPHRKGEGVITGGMLARSWGFLGPLSAALVMGAFFFVLLRAGWHPGDRTAAGSPLHHAYLQATTTTFAGIVMCQVGTAFAVRTEHASLRQVGLLTNPLLLWGVAFELAFTALLVYAPPAQHIFGTAPLPLGVLGILATFPFIIWGADETRRWIVRSRRDARRHRGPAPDPA